MGITAPERLTADHRVEDFTCTHPSLTRWLKEKALTNQATRASNCFVVCDDAGDGKTVVGYYALANGSMSHEIAIPKLRRNMPDPIPVALLGRLAVHSDYEGKGIGSGLLRDATLRCLKTASEGPSSVAILCHAIDEEAKQFYLHHGFVESPVEALTVMLSLKKLASMIEEVPPPAA